MDHRNLADSDLMTLQLGAGDRQAATKSSLADIEKRKKGKQTADAKITTRK